MKVQDVINAIVADCRLPAPLERTCDILVAGRPDMEVTGIVTTFMATVDVIRKAAEIGANMIITHEPTWFNGPDEIDWLREDPVYLAKKKLLEDLGIAVWRFHDHMHFARPDRIYEGLNRELGWQAYYKPQGTFHHIYEIDEHSLAELAAFLKEKLKMNYVRVIGDPAMVCRKIGILVGGGSLGLGREVMPMEFMREHNLDCIVCGEITEWTLSAYVNDARMLGMNKSMIVIGHERSEEWGMKDMARWLKPLVGGLPVTFIEAGEPFAYL